MGTRGYVRKFKIDKESTVIETVRGGLAEEFAAICLRTKMLTKEERLFALMGLECDKDGHVLMHQVNKDSLREIVGITIDTYHTYIDRWRKKGLVKTSGKWVTFEAWVGRGTKGIAVLRNPEDVKPVIVEQPKEVTNGMVERKE